MLSFEHLQHLFARSTDPSSGRFYRTFYQTHNYTTEKITSLEDWRAIPLITKDDLIALPLRDRSFLPLGEVSQLRTSSGTSGKGPLFSPCSDVHNMEYRMEYHDFKNPFLSFTVPIKPHQQEEYQQAHGHSGRVLMHDPRNPRASVLLAKAAGVDGMSLFVYQVQKVGQEMKRQSMNEQIKFIEVTGEICSHALYTYMRETFPHAKILQSYGASEVEDEHIGMPCRPMDGTEPLAVYHPKESHYLEIVDPKTGAVLEPRAGVEGDLVISTYPGDYASFPFVRFSIGDTVRVVEDACAKHGTWTYTVLGRTSMDFIKITGGVLRADEVARALRLFPTQVSDFFELHCALRQTSIGPLIEPVLHIETKRPLDFSAFAEALSRELRTGPSFTYAQGVLEGRYLPLQCTELGPTESLKKHRRVFWD